MKAMKPVNGCSPGRWFAWSRPNPNRVDALALRPGPYRKRDEIERLFRRIKGYRRIFSRFEALDCAFLAFLCFALIVEALSWC
jgi:hypothetical protein